MDAEQNTGVTKKMYHHVTFQAIPATTSIDDKPQKRKINPGIYAGHATKERILILDLMDLHVKIRSW